MDNYLDLSASQLRLFEATVPWMYLDTEGNVTAAVGTMLSSAAAALRLPFVDQTGNPSSAFDVTAEFLRVKKMHPGQVAKAYYLPTAPILQLAEITRLLDQAVDLCDAMLSRTFDKYALFPDSAKLALIDMDYNLGHTKLIREFVHFCAAVSAMKWEQAAGLCHRIGPSQERNDWTRQQFLNAATVEA